jgi:hypothetical protein
MTSESRWWPPKRLARVEVDSPEWDELCREIAQVLREAIRARSSDE